jgi:ethanolamine permease
MPADLLSMAFGNIGGLIAGYATMIEFLFATPAISLALGSYIHFLYPATPVMAIAVTAYFIFTFINLLGIKEAAVFSLIVTILAIAELLLFVGITIPHFKLQTFLHNPMPFGWADVFAALPFAIWLFVCLEGIAMVAEEAKGKSAIIKGYIAALLTLTLLALAVMLCVGGIADWEKMDTIDYPLPEAIAVVLGKSNSITRLFAGIGSFGLIASFHGIIISYSRQLFALSRSGFLPEDLAALSSKKRVPYVALIAGALLGILSLFFLDTSKLVVLSTIGAVVVYIISMLSLFKLRKGEPNLERPFKAPLYPFFPAVALLLATITLAAMIYAYGMLCLLFLAGLVFIFILYYIVAKFKGYSPSGLNELD